MLLWIAMLSFLAFGVFWMTAMPGRSHRGPLPPLGPAEEESRARLERHVTALAAGIGERNVFRPERLESAAKYVESRLSELGYAPARQSFAVQETSVSNIEVERRGSREPEAILLVGAHYDSVVGSPGADDNATGVAALLELARLLRSESCERTVRLVFFVNEEPPFFQTEAMGSLRYARRCRERGERVASMLSLESLGFYSDADRSQQYPFPLGLLYPSRADFVAFVSSFGSRPLVTRAIASFRRGAAFPSEGAAAPATIPGVGWSDHWAFWRHGYPALMVTDTALFRYPDYHTERDTPERVDYGRLARVVTGLLAVVRDLSRAD